MKIYTIGTEEKEIKVGVKSGKHIQGIWHTSTIIVSEATARRIKKELGYAEKYNAVNGDFGQAQKVVVLREDFAVGLNYMASIANYPKSVLA